VRFGLERVATRCILTTSKRATPHSKEQTDEKNIDCQRTHQRSGFASSGRKFARQNTKEVARFSKSGMGWVCLGAAGRALIKGIGWVDEIKFDGSQHTYDMLVTLEVIEPKRVVAA
jgi:hypothetical protein